MTKYPIRVEPLQPYYGDDPKRQRKFEEDCRNAERIADYINRKMENECKGQKAPLFTFGEIAIALRLKERKVQSYLHGYSGASDNSIEIEAQ